MIERSGVVVGKVYFHQGNHNLYEVRQLVKLKIDGVWTDAVSYSPLLNFDTTLEIPVYVRTVFNFRERFTLLQEIAEEVSQEKLDKLTSGEQL